jgi:glycosyltransferase involved in cell wall biosynthesis
MRILFLSHYFPPEVNAPASRTFEHCREWVRAGHEVTVVTCAPNHPQGRVYDGYSNRLLAREKIDGIDVIRIWTYVTPNEGFLKRTLGYVSFMMSAILLLPFFGKANVVVTTSPQFFNGLAGFFASRLKRIPWVLEIRDLWPDSIFAVGAIRNRHIIALLSALERFAYRTASHIVVVTDAFKAHIARLGIPQDRITVIKNGVDLDLFKQPTDSEIAQLRNLISAQTGVSVQGKFIASYVGTHGMAHRLETLMEAAQLCSDDERILFLMVGDGAERRNLLELRDRLQLRNVLMLEQMPKSSMPAIWGITDASLVLLKRSDLFKTVIPSKIFESMAMQKPIVMGVEGEASALVNAAGAGICIEPENAQQLAQALKRLCNDSELYGQLAQSGSHFVRTHFDRRRLASVYLDVLAAQLPGVRVVSITGSDHGS